MSKNSQILEAVGGLEAAQVIVERAPKGATHYIVSDAIFYYYKQEPFRLSVWIDDYWQSLFNDFGARSQLYTSLFDLHTAITEQREFDLGLAPDDAYVKAGFKVGDRVVLKRVDTSDDSTDLLMIEKIEGQHIYCGNLYDVYIESNLTIRLATPAEIAAGHRIDEPYNHEKFQNLAESLREIGGQYQDENHLARQAYETSAAYIERELQELCGTPVAPSQTHAELVLHEQIKNLNSSRNFWRVMFFAAFICYGVAWWLV